MRREILATTAAVLLIGVAAGAQASPGEASAVLKGASGDIGSVKIHESPKGVLLHVDISGLTPGWHAMHFHAVGDCSDPKFLSSGGHINDPMMKRPHGLLNVEGPDFGDLPNIYVGADGTGMAEAFSTLVSLTGAGGRPPLLLADGSAVVIHAGPDDYVTQPIGGAGARVACGVVKAD
jgi:Cu-Zn family superoxide dismutase